MPIHQIFYWIASIVLILLGLLCIIAVSVVLYIRHRFTKLANHTHFVLDEVTSLIQHGKNHLAGSVRTSLFGSALGALMRIIRGRKY